MRIYVDESGDTGLRLERGSSEFFSVTAVLFENDEGAECCAKHIEQLTRSLRVRREFHFNKCSRCQRMEFLQAMNLESFSFCSVVMNKKLLWSPGFRAKEPFHKSATNYVFQNCLDRLANATVTIDGSGDREFRRSLQGYLKKKTRRGSGESRIKRVLVRDSEKEPLLQLADMVCGAVARSYSQKGDRQIYLDAIKRIPRMVQFWPPNPRREMPAS